MYDIMSSDNKRERYRTSRAEPQAGPPMGASDRRRRVLPPIERGSLAKWAAERRLGETTMRYEFDFASLWDYWPTFLRGAIGTLELTAAATALGLAIGILCAIGRRSRVGWLRDLCGVYVEAVRNTPFLVQIFFIFISRA